MEMSIVRKESFMKTFLSVICTLVISTGVLYIKNWDME